MNLSTRIDLSVPYSEKEDAKALGARWDPGRKVWFAPPGIELGDLDRWLPDGVIDTGPVEPPDSAEPREGVSLTDLLSRLKGVIERGMPEAAWVRAEVSELRGKGGHLYLTLVEQNGRGHALAKAKGVIFRNQATAVTAKFERATGEGLRADIKILCLAKVRFEPLYGLDLIIEDVDPAYTVGDLAAKLARIRERLVIEGLHEKNRGLAAPVEFVRVAVISPETSAGLGDFRRETDRLHDAGLCEFYYYPATFQGLDAPSSIRTAINEALAAHRLRPFDALAIIRGGGSVTDLAWLNDLELTRLVCRSPIPVLTGIGHERDSTILDEIAHRRFDTPSKVALHISATVKDNALAALAAAGQIRLQVARILARERTALATQADRIESGILAMTRRAEDDHRKLMGEIRTAIVYQLRETARSLAAEYARFIGTAKQTLCEAEIGMRQSMDSIAHRSHLHLGLQKAAVDKAANVVALQSTAKIEAATCDIDNRKAQMGRDATRLITKAAEDLNCDAESVANGAVALVEAARREIESSTRIVVGLGPQATLRRGFSITRDAEDRPITSREAAMRNAEIKIQFHDGIVPVAVRGSEGGDGR